MIKTKEQIEGIRQAGRINTKVLDYVETHMKDFLKVSVQASMMQFVMAYLIRILF